MLGLLAGLAMREGKARVEATVRRAMLGLAALLLALVGLGFLLAAGFIAAAESMGALNAALAFGAAFLVLSGLVALIARVPRRSHGLAQESLAALDQAPQAVAEGVAKAPGLSLMAAFAGGLILALRLRR